MNVIDLNEFKKGFEQTASKATNEKLQKYVIQAGKDFDEAQRVIMSANNDLAEAIAIMQVASDELKKRAQEQMQELGLL